MRRRSMWLKTPTLSVLVLSQYFDSGPAASSAPFAQVRCTGTVVFLLIRTTCHGTPWGDQSPGRARSRGETYMRPSSLASCMHRMPFLTAITAGVFEPPPSSQAEITHETQPWLTLPCPPSMDRPARFRSGMVQVAASSRIWGRVDMSLRRWVHCHCHSPRAGHGINYVADECLRSTLQMQFCIARSFGSVCTPPL
jgi:hypothetical protein